MPLVVSGVGATVTGLTMRFRDGRIVEITADGDGASVIEEHLAKDERSRFLGEVVRDGDRDALVAFLKEAPRQAELPRHLRARDTSSPEGNGDPDVEALDDTASRAMLLRGGSAGARDPLSMGG